MKRLLIAFCVFCFFSSKAQYFDLNPAYMNTLSAYNPANSGFNSKMSISTQSLFKNPSFDNTSNSFWALGDVKWKALHGGLGINYNHYDNSSSRSNTFKINYNYQLQLSENQRLSIGIAGGYDRVHINDMGTESFYGTDIDSRYTQGFIIWDPGIYKPAAPTSKSAFSGGLGLIYRYKNLEFGFSANNFMDYQIQLEDQGQSVYQYYWSFSNHTLINSYLDYQFHLFKWMDVNPTFALQGVNSSGYNLFMNKLDFIVKDRVNFGLQASYGVSNLNQAWFFLGCKIKDRFSVNYSYGAYVSRFNNQIQPSHLAGLTFAIDQD